jgi:hypothetical protein
MPEGLYGTKNIDKNKKQKHYVFRLNMNGYNFSRQTRKRSKWIDRNKLRRPGKYLDQKKK